jgi:hypothetical protein
MFNKTGCLAAILVLLVVCGISWLLTSGIIWLICLCFGLTFSWGVATGVWLILLLLGGIFQVHGGK